MQARILVGAELRAISFSPALTDIMLFNISPYLQHQFFNLAFVSGQFAIDML